VEKDPAADATDAPQPYAFLCNLMMELLLIIIIIIIIIIIVFFLVTEHRWNEIDRGRPKYSGKTYPSATLSTTNPHGD
jgi:heme/copper-type cytochrome/quinol oxidase subunit 2